MSWCNHTYFSSSFKIKKLSLQILGLLQKFEQVFPTPSLMTICKAFIIRHLKYRDFVFDCVFLVIDCIKYYNLLTAKMH